MTTLAYTNARLSEAADVILIALGDPDYPEDNDVFTLSPDDARALYQQLHAALSALGERRTQRRKVQP